MIRIAKMSHSSHGPVYKSVMRILVCMCVALIALGCGGDEEGAAGVGGDGGLGGMTGAGGTGGQPGTGGDSGAGGDGGIGGESGAGGDAGAGGEDGAAGAGGEAGTGGVGGAAGSGGDAGAGGPGGSGGSGGEIGTGGSGGFPGNLCPNLFSIIPIPRNIPEGTDRTTVETRAADNDELPMLAVLTLSALWGTFENTENLRCAPGDFLCGSPNIIFQNATYICSQPGTVELCVEANDGACTKTRCTEVTCP